MVNLSRFDPHAPAPITRSKVWMTEIVRSDLGAFVAALREQPEGKLRLGGVELVSDLYTTAELLAIYDPAGRTNTTANGVGRELARQGFYRACNGQPIRVGGVQSRYWSIRNGRAWDHASPSSAAKHILAAQDATKPPVKKY